MKMSYHDYGPVSVLTLSGEYTAEDADVFRRTCTDRRNTGARDIVLDCEHLEFVDSAGLESWLELQETLGNNGGQFRLVNLDDTVRKILELTRLDLAFEAHGSIENAVRSLR